MDAKIGDSDLFYEACKDLSLSDWENRLNEMFKEFTSISENTEPMVLGRDKDRQVEIYEGDLEGGLPGVSSSSTYNSINKGVYGTSSSDGSGYVLLEVSSEMRQNDTTINPWSSEYDFYDIFTGSIYPGYPYKITLDGTIDYEATSKVFNRVNWQAWDFPGENYFHVTKFKNSRINCNTASTDVVGYLMTAEGVSLTVEITISYAIYADNYSD